MTNHIPAVLGVAAAAGVLARLSRDTRKREEQNVVYLNIDVDEVIDGLMDQVKKEYPKTDDVKETE